MESKTTELPDPDWKAKNIKAFLNVFINKKHIQASNKDEVEAYIKNIKALPSYEDPVACAGRTCDNCEVCDSLRKSVCEIKEIIDKPEEEAPILEAAKHAVEEGFKQPEEIMSKTIEFSEWDKIKFIRESLLKEIKIDIFKVKNDIKKNFFIDYVTREQWFVIRTTLILNSADWWLENIAEGKNGILHLVDKKDHVFLPRKMMFPKEDGTFMDINEYIKSLNPKTRNVLLSVQNDVNSRFKSLASWTVNFNRS
jgi:hypothetical protein